MSYYEVPQFRFQVVHDLLLSSVQIEVTNDSVLMS
jgi:hypothetical protein